MPKLRAKRVEGFAFSLMLVGTLITAGCAGPRVAMHQEGGHWGEFGGNMNYLNACYSGPQHQNESNFYIDLLGGAFRDFAEAQGFVNNHTLFIVSHGKALQKGLSQRYALYPTLTIPNPSYYSAKDIAQILLPHASQVHNILLAGCNVENAFTAREFKKYFVNATNIVHARPETDASVDAFQNILAHSSHEIKSGSVTTLGDFFSSKPLVRSKNNYYIAELFHPGSDRPFKKQPAGRELLTGDGVQMAANTATNLFARRR